MQEMNDRVAKIMVADVTPHEANGGLNQGRPDMCHTKRVHEQLLDHGFTKQAQA